MFNLGMMTTFSEHVSVILTVLLWQAFSCVFCKTFRCTAMLAVTLNDSNERYRSLASNAN